MVKVTTADMADGSGQGLHAKAEPIMTRSVAAAAREALANHQAEKAAALTDSSYRKRSIQKTPSVVSNMASQIFGSSPDSPSQSHMPRVLDCHSYAKSPIMDGHELDDQEEDGDQQSIRDGLTNGQEEGELSTANRDAITISQLKGDQMKTVKSNVKIEISVSDDNEGSVSMATTVANTDVTKPLIIQTKFSTSSPGPSSESTDTASEVGSMFNSPPGSSTTSANSSPNTSLLKHLANQSELEVLPEKIEIGQEALMRVKAELEGHKCRDARKDLGQYETMQEGYKFKRMEDDENISPNSKSKFSSTHGFTPKVRLYMHN